MRTGNSDYLSPAGPGEVWVLTDTHTDHNGYPWSQVDVFLHPRTALAELAGRLRKRWEQARPTRRWLPVAPPAQDLAVIAVYYREIPHVSRAGAETFQLDRIGINDSPTPIPAGPDIILRHPGNEFICHCGNRADLGGFYASTVDGMHLGDDVGSDWYTCATCGRIIHEETGEIVKRLPSCVNCHTPIQQQHGVWRHVSVYHDDHRESCSGYLSPEGGNATPPPVAFVSPLLADRAASLTTALVELLHAWEEQNPDDSTEVALSQGFPFSASLEDIVASAGSWAEHVADLADQTVQASEHSHPGPSDERTEG